MKGSLGQKIQEARQDQGITLEEAAHATKIKEHYLRAIEEDNLEALPSLVQQRGFVRSYADFLGLEAETLFRDWSASPTPQVPEQRVESPPPPRAPKPGESTFEDIGVTLRKHRETLGFSVADVENQIHVHERYLKAIEDGRLDDLPSTVQGRGMLKNYAEFLGLDADDVLLRYAEVLQARLASREKVSSSTKLTLSLPMWLRRVFSGNVMVGLLIVLILGVVIVWSSMQVFGGGIGGADEGTSTIPGVAQVLLPSPTSTITLTPTASSEEGITVEGDDTPGTAPSVTATLETQAAESPPVSGNVNIQLIVNQRAWMQVIVDGQEAFNGRVLPGSVHVFDGEERVELVTGNGAALEVIFNQRDLGVLGLFGEVVNLIYTVEGVATPTPTVSPTPTITPTPEDTATPSPTPPTAD
jgi:cytoskeletal protein RodZ